MRQNMFRAMYETLFFCAAGKKRTLCQQWSDCWDTLNIRHRRSTSEVHLTTPPTRRTHARAGALTAESSWALQPTTRHSTDCTSRRFDVASSWLLQHTRGSRQDTRGTRVPTSVGRPWVAGSPAEGTTVRRCTRHKPSRGSEFRHTATAPTQQHS